MVARERLPVGRVDMRRGGEGRAPRGAEVGARERLPLGRIHVQVGTSGRAHWGVLVGSAEWGTASTLNVV